MAMPIRRRRPLGAASRNRSGIETVMSPFADAQAEHTRIGGSDSTPTTAFAGPRRCRFRTTGATRSPPAQVPPQSQRRSSLADGGSLRFHRGPGGRRAPSLPRTPQRLVRALTVATTPHAVPGSHGLLRSTSRAATWEPRRHGAAELARDLDEIDRRLRTEMDEVGEVFIAVTSRGEPRIATLAACGIGAISPIGVC
jgi:hypothetical protein